MTALVILFAIAVAILLSMLFGALLVASAGAIFLDTAFGDAWSAAWDRPGFLFLFAVIASLLFGSKAQSSRR